MSIYKASTYSRNFSNSIGLGLHISTKPDTQTKKKHSQIFRFVSPENWGWQCSVYSPYIFFRGPHVAWLEESPAACTAYRLPCLHFTTRFRRGGGGGGADKLISPARVCALLVLEKNLKGSQGCAEGTTLTGYSPDLVGSVTSCKASDVGTQAVADEVKILQSHICRLLFFFFF